jgi:hypothetical protein
MDPTEEDQCWTARYGNVSVSRITLGIHAVIRQLVRFDVIRFNRLHGSLVDWLIDWLARLLAGSVGWDGLLVGWITSLD